MSILEQIRLLSVGWLVPSCNAGHFAYVSEHGLLTGMLEVEFLGDASYLTVYSAPLRPDLESYTIPAGEVFLLGDNRSNSSDHNDCDNSNYSILYCFHFSFPLVLLTILLLFHP